MWKKLGKRIVNNFGLKVLAVIFAIIVWLAIVNVADPDKSTTFTVPVEMINTDYLTDQGKTFEVLDNTDMISFTVTGKRSIVENLTADDFRATANFENIDDSFSMVPIVLTATSYSSQLEITRRVSYMMLQVEDLVTVEYEITVNLEGSPAPGCFVADTEVSPETVTVTGARSLIEEIDVAQVTLNVEELEESVTSTATIVLLNENGFVLNEEDLTLESTEAEVTARILMRKSVPLSFKVSGEPADGYWYQEPECEGDAVLLDGEPSVLSEMEEITINGMVLNVRDRAEDLTVSVALSDYLPEGVTPAEGEPEELVITVPVVPATVITTELSAEDITVTGLADGLTLTIRTDPVTVVVTGTEEDLTRFNANRLEAVLDVSGLDEGSHTVTFRLGTDGNYKAEATISINIR